MALAKYQYNETSDYVGWRIGFGQGANEFDFGQTFTSAITHYLSKIELLLFRTGTVGTVTIEIRPTSGGIPLGDEYAYAEALATKTVDVSAITTDTAGEWVAFTLDTPIQLIADTVYGIVVAASTTGGGHEVTWRAKSGGNVYTRGEAVFNSDVVGDDWYFGDPRTSDFTFRDWGELTASGSLPVANVGYTKKLVAVGANEVWYEDEAGSMIELTAANGDIDVTKGLDMVEAYGKAFIVNDTKFRVVDFINTVLDLGSGNEMTVPPGRGDLLTQTGTSAEIIVDFVDTDKRYIYGKVISGIFNTTGDITQTTQADSALNAMNPNPITATLDDATAPTIPHWYNWTVYPSITLVAGGTKSFGAMPDQATIIALYQGRLVLAGDEDYPHMWYQSRQANPWNWLYGINDAQSAVAGNDADAGEIGDVVTAVIPYKDDFCIYGAAGSIWYLVGNAAEGGVILELSLTAGILASKAWCWDSADNLYILATTGLLRIPKGFGIPENLTGQSYPNFIKDLDYDDVDDRLTMAYDRIRHGIHICKTELADGTNKNWWYDLKIEGGGLFPETFPEECGVCSAFYYESNDPDYRDLLFGCYDGYIRFSDDTAENDNIGANVVTDVERIDSYVCFGPLALAGGNKEGKLTSLTGILAGGGLIGGSQTDSDDVDYKIFTGLAAEKVLEKLVANTSPDVSGSISAPGRIRGSIKRQTVRGAFIGIRIGNDDAGKTWALERLLVNAKELGRIK